MRPGACRVPDDHQKIARAEPHRLLQRLDRGIARSAEGVCHPEISARKARVWVELGRASQPPDRVVVPLGKQLVKSQRRVRGRVEIV